MKRDKLFRLSLAILFLWTSLALAAPAAMAASSTALPGSSLWEPYLQQSRIDLEKAASSPWETLKSFLPRSFGALVRQTASRYTSVLLFAFPYLHQRQRMAAASPRSNPTRHSDWAA